MRGTRMFVTTAVLVAVIALWAASVAASGMAASPTPLAASATASPAATDPAPSPTATPALTLTATPATITAGGTATLTARLGVAGATLLLSRQAADASDFRPVVTLVTDARGVARFSAHPRLNATYRVEFAGDAQWLPASAETGVLVRPRLSLSAAARAYRGRRVRLGVAVVPAHPGAGVTVEVYADGVWTEWRSLTLGGDSRVNAGWRADRDGVRRLRVVMAEDDAHARGASAVRRVRVVKPNPYRVPLGAKRVVVVDKSQYRLHVFSYGREVRSFRCVLGRPGLPTPTGRFRIYAKGRWPGGPFGARIMSYHSPYAIHGTNEPHLLRRFPRNYSHGCTRLANADAIWLYDHAPIGTPVWNVP